MRNLQKCVYIFLKYLIIISRQQRRFQAPYYSLEETILPLLNKFHKELRISISEMLI